MEDWKEYKISDICNIKHGFAFKGQYFTDSKQIYICTTPGNFALKGGFKLDKPKYYNGPIPADYILHRDDLIVTMTDLSKEGDTLGYSALVPQDFKHTLKLISIFSIGQCVHTNIKDILLIIVLAVL